MDAEILALFIPIAFIIGLFSVIAMNILFKYKAKAMVANRMESIDEWYKAETRAKIIKAEAQAIRRQNVEFRVSGLLMGLGLGVTIGLVAVACGAFSSVGQGDDFDQIAVAVFTIISLAVFFSGVGLVGASLLARRLDRKAKAQ